MVQPATAVEPPGVPTRDEWPVDLLARLTLLAIAAIWILRLP